MEVFSKTTTKVTIGFSDGQVIFLPLNYDYPVFLNPNESIKFAVGNLQGDESLQLSVKKCDQSNPYIFYTTDQNEFAADLYSNYDRFGTESVFTHILRTKDNSQLFIKLKADPKETSTLIVKVEYVYSSQDNFVDLDAGNMGLVTYQFSNLNQLQLNFTGLQCGV